MKEQCELLDSKTIISTITPQNRGFLSHLEILSSIDSTNTYLLAQAKKNSSCGWVCFAEEQTQGRGRQNKQWFSPYGSNIYASLLWHFSPSFSGISALGVACGVMMVQVLKRLGIVRNIGLKWPNDVLFSGQKLAGILLESIVTLEQIYMVIGIGLNVYLSSEKNNHWVGMGDILGASLSRNKIAGILLDELLVGISLFQQQGLLPFLSTWHEHDILFMKDISLITATTVITGRAQGINNKGELVLLDSKGKEHCFCYGEVSVLKSNVGYGL